MSLTPNNPLLKSRIPALKTWFGNSKVVDDKGEPLVVYHGSKSPWVISFDLGMEGTGVVRSVPIGGIWFTSNRENAGFYADYAPKGRADERTIQVYGDEGKFYAAVSTSGDKSLFQAGPYPTEEKAEAEGLAQARMYNKKLRSDTHVMAVYLKIENPLVLDGIVPRKAEFEQARKEGHDGIIATGVVDGSHFSDVYVIFNPNQVKSADRNVGTFDPSDITITAAAEKPLDYGLIVNILHELMKDVEGNLPCPELKIVNDTRSRWVGTNEWKPSKPDNTTITLQKSICFDEDTLRRTLAHELAHHEQILLFWAKWSADPRTFKLMERLEGSHGKVWRDIAARWNARHGKDFVTEKSDQSKDVQIHQEKPYFLFISKTTPNSFPMWQANIRLSDKTKKYLSGKNLENYRLVVTSDRDFIKGKLIGSNRWAYVPVRNQERDKARLAKLEALWQQPDIRLGWNPPPPANVKEESKLQHKRNEEERALRAKQYEELKSLTQKNFGRAASEELPPEPAATTLDDIVPTTVYSGGQYSKNPSLTASAKTAFVRQDLTWLKNYLTMSRPEMGEDLAHQWTSYFVDWLSQNEPELLEKLGFTLNEDEAGDDYDERRNEFADRLSDDNLFDQIPPEVFDRFLEDGENYVMQNDPADSPSFLHLMYKGVVKNQWLVHYTDNPDKVAEQGFTIGMHDLSRLGLTTYYSETAKPGGYNYAVPANDVHSIRGLHFGDHAVLFRASGILTYHTGDEFYQVIFWGAGARDIIPIYHEGENWSLPPDSRGRPIFQNGDLQTVVDWAMANFDQYRWMANLVGSKVKEPKPTEGYFEKQREDRERWEKEHGSIAAGLKNPLLHSAAVRKQRIQRKMNKTVTASHKQTPHRENIFKDTGEGEGTNGYANQPECVDGTKDALSLETLTEQAKMASVGFPSWEEFLAKHRRTIDGFMEENLERWEPWGNEKEAWGGMTPEEQEEYITQAALEELERRYDELSRQHRNWEFPMDVYRELSVLGGPQVLDIGKVGICWSWDEDSAEAHWGHYGEGFVQITLKATIQEADVDWDDTMLLNLEPSIGEQEKEIRLKEGCHPTIVSWKLRNGEWQPPLKNWKMVTASDQNATEVRSSHKEPWQMTQAEFVDPYPKPQPGYRILYTMTDPANLDSIRERGLLTDKATGYEAPKGMLWATNGPTDYSKYNGLIAFRVPLNDPQVRYANNTDWMITRDIPPDDILDTWAPLLHPTEARSEGELIPAYDYTREDVMRSRVGERAHKMYVQDAIAEGKIGSHPDYPELGKKATAADNSEDQTKMASNDSTGTFHKSEMRRQAGAEPISGEDVVDYVQSQHPKWNRQEIYLLVGLDAGGDYVLKDLPLDSLEATDDYDPETAKMYAEMTTPLPPIIMDGDGDVRDGNHRLAAAKMRGDKTIKAYVPIDASTGVPRAF